MSAYNIPAPNVTAARWYGIGTTLKVGEYQVSNALVFAGTNLSGVWSAAVDTALPAAQEGVAGKPGARTYAQLGMRQRHAFLAWLASGRRTPLMDPSILMAFITSAEQYLLEHEGPREPAQEAALMTELLALHEAYSKTQSTLAMQCLLLRDYVWIRTQEAQASIGEYAPLECLPGVATSPAMRWVLGQYAAWQAALPGEWAYLWSRTQVRGVHLRLLPLYEDVLRRLFLERYAEKFGIGITFSPNEASPEEVGYSPIHPGLQGRIIRLRQPAMFLRSSPLWMQQLSAMMAECMLDLQHYIDARFAGKSVEESANLLPVALWPEEERRQFRDLVANALERPTTASFERLAPFFKATSALSAKNLEQVQDGVYKLGLACFPPLRRLTKPASAEAPLVLFPCEKPDTLADDLTALAQGPVGLLLRVLAAESPQAREALALALTVGADTDTRITANQKTSLPAVWAWLKAGGPKPITAAQWKKIADSIQAQEALALLPRWCAEPHLLPPTPGIDRLLGTRWRAAPLTLNQQKVAALTQETAEVSQLLGRVFDEPAAPVEPVTLAATTSVVSNGYDGFMSMLLTRDNWSVEEFEALARQHGLMAGAAAEWVNDRAYDEQGAPALEEQDGGWACDKTILQALINAE